MKQRAGPSAANDLLGASAAGLLVVVFSLLLLCHNPNVFWYDDYQISILPVFADIARSWSEGHWPLLSPYSWVCSNLAGEFQYGTFSVFVNAAVILIWKFPLLFAQQAAALSVVHLVALASGAYMLARGRDLAPPLALMVALVGALNGWMMCWGASDWFGALGAFAWLPWSWWALERGLRRDAPRTHVLLPAAFIYLLITGGFPYTILMLALVTAWLGLRALVRRDWFAPLRLALGWLLGVGLSAPAWMALLEYSAGSRRATEVFDPQQWVVPARALPGLLLPSWSAPWTMFHAQPLPHAAVELACGLAPIVIVFVALLRNGHAVLAKLGWELGLLAVVLTVAMLPSAGMFRFSFRALPLFHLVLALIAAEAFRLWPEKSLARPKFGAWALLLIVAVCGAFRLLGMRLLDAGPTLALLFLALAILWRFVDSRREPWILPALVFAALLAGYLAHPMHGPVARFGFNENLKDSAPLDRDRLYLSLYHSPPEYYNATKTAEWYGTYTRPGSTAMFAGVHLVNGYSPVGPAGICRLLDFGTHGHVNPPRVSEVVLPEAGPGGLLEQIGIDGLLVAGDFALPAPLPDNWKEVASSWEGTVYHRDVVLPPVRALPDAEFGGAAIQLIENSRERVLAEVTPAEATRPVRVVFSRPYFPGYHAAINGRSLPVTSLKGLVPMIDLPAGDSGRLELVYRPHYVTIGGPIALATFLAVLASFAILRRGES